MAQLSDDCFAFGGDLMRLDEAAAQIMARVPLPESHESVALREALGRVLAVDLQAPIDVPGFANSAVDGYAVRHADLAAEGETRLPVVARVPAGESTVAPIAPGTAVRIFTGAAMPPGADTVFMQEDVREADGHALLPPGLKRGANRREPGEDFRSGTAVLHAGTRLGPAHLAAAAALGLANVPVRPRPRIALFSTGDEIVPPGLPLRYGAQYDANATLLAALCERRGAIAEPLGILPDRAEAVAAALRAAAAGHDLILTSGGVSAGEEDHVRKALEQVGRLGFWRLAIKPGRPVAMGTIAGAAFMGLPGNPVASFVTFVTVAALLIDRLAGCAAAAPLRLPARARFSYRKKAGRREYARVSLQAGPDGMLEAERFPREGAALISSLIGTDGLAELPEDSTGVAQGDIIRVLPYAALMA